MKKVLVLLLCVVMVCGVFLGCATKQEEKVAENTPEVVKEKLFSAMREEISGSKFEGEVVPRLKEYEGREIQSSETSENEYFFACDTGYANPSETEVILWTDNIGDVKAIGLATVGNEGRSILIAAIRTYEPNLSIDEISDEVFDFIYTDESATKEFDNVIVTKKFSSGSDVYTTGEHSSLYILKDKSATDNEEFNATLDEGVSALESLISIL